MQKSNNNIIDQLEANYRQAAAEYVDHELETLANLGEQNNQPTTIYEGGTINLVLIISSILVLLLYVSYAIYSSNPILTLSLLIMIGLLAWQALLTYRRIGKPLLTLTAEGIELPVAEQIIYWQDIDHFYISPTQKLIFNFRLKPDLKLAISKQSLVKINYYPEQNHLQAIMLDFKNRKKTDYYRSLFMGYWDSGMARARLRELAD